MNNIFSCFLFFFSLSERERIQHKKTRVRPCSIGKGLCERGMKVKNLVVEINGCAFSH